MDPHYNDFHRQALDLQYKLHDVLDDVNNPMAHTLRNEVHQLVGDIEGNKSPRAVEDRVKVIQQQLQQARHQGDGLMDFNHNEMLHHSYEDMRIGLRKLPHY